MPLVLNCRIPYSEHRFHLCLPPDVRLAPCRTAQLAPHPSQMRTAHRLAAWSPRCCPVFNSRARFESDPAHCRQSRAAPTASGSAGRNTRYRRPPAAAAHPTVAPPLAPSPATMLLSVAACVTRCATMKWSYVNATSAVAPRPLRPLLLLSQRFLKLFRSKVASVEYAIL